MPTDSTPTVGWNGQIEVSADHMINGEPVSLSVKLMDASNRRPEMEAVAQKLIDVLNDHPDFSNAQGSVGVSGGYAITPTP